MITFAGSTRSLEETAVYYAQADVFVMPSFTEVWGLVVNEALAAGLLVLSSKYAGATPDLITQAPTFVGLSIDPGDPRDIQRAMEQVIARFRNGSVNHQEVLTWGRTHTPERYAAAILTAIKRSEEAVRPSPPLHAEPEPQPSLGFEQEH